MYYFWKKNKDISTRLYSTIYPKPSLATVYRKLSLTTVSYQMVSGSHRPREKFVQFYGQLPDVRSSSVTFLYESRLVRKMFVRK